MTRMSRTGDSLHDAGAILDGAGVPAPDEQEAAARRTVVAYSRTAEDRDMLFDVLGLGPAAEPEAALAAVPPVTAPAPELTPEQQAARDRARRVREAAARTHLAGLGWAPAAIDRAVADLGGGAA